MPCLYSVRAKKNLLLESWTLDWPRPCFGSPAAPGNVYVRTHPELGGPQLVVLDHGLYHRLDDDTRCVAAAAPRGGVFQKRVIFEFDLFVHFIVY